MNKRGQFYLVAALIIILLFLSFNEINFRINSTENNERAENLVRQISFEASQIIDYATLNLMSDTATMKLLNETLYLYAADNPDTEFAFAYGNDSSIASSAFIEHVSLSDTNQRVLKTPTLSYSMNKAILTLDEKDNYEFNVSSGKNFFLIVKIRSGNERIVATN